MENSTTESAHMKSIYVDAARTMLLAYILTAPIHSVAQSRKEILFEREQARIEYERRIAATPRPTSSEEHNRTCRDLRIEAARQRGVGERSREMFSGKTAVEVEIAWQRNVALIESKAEEFNCSAPFSDKAGTAEARERSPIQQCIAACTEHTKRTSEQCFDACNK